MRKHARPVLFGLALAAAAGCASMGLAPDRSPGVESEIQDAERRAHEDRTRSALAAMEVGLADFLKAEGGVPAKLDALIPKYLSEIPVADVGLRAHSASADVKYYPAEVIQDEMVDGTRLRDTGRWGFAFNGRRAILFVDCTHKTTLGELWYQVRGIH